MRRILKIIGITVLWICALAFIWAMVPPSRSPKETGMRPIAPAGRTVKFIYKGNDKQKDVAVLVPVIAPAFGAKLDSGPPTLQRNTLLDCIPDTRKTVFVLAGGQQGTATEILLVCGEQVLVIKEVYFDP